jgi:hypothetical protein
MKKALLLLLFIVAAQIVWAGDKMQIKVVETSWTIETNKYGTLIIITAKVILPDGSHADLLCRDNDNCAVIEPVEPEKMPPDSKSCPKMAVPGTTMCITKNLGTYLATRKGNYLTIYAPNGKLTFHIVGSW